MAREEAEIKELSKKLAQNPDSMVFVQLADAYRRVGELEKSVEVCQQGLERHPTYTTARAILGRNFLDLGKLDEAAGEFRKIEVSDPDNIVAHRMLGQIYMAKGMYSEAIVRHQKVLSLDPDDAAAQDLLKEALAKAKEQDQGRAAAAAAAPAPAPAASAPAAPAGGEHMGTIKVAEIYIKKGAFDEAAEVLQEILASDPGNALARQKLKEVDEKRGAKSGAADAAKAKAEADAAAKKKAEEEAKARAEADAAAKKKAEEEAKRKAEADAAAKKKAEEEARAKAEADAAAKKKAEEEAKRKAEADAAAKKKAEEEARAKAEADAAAKKKAEEEARAKAEADAAAKKKAEEEAKAKAKAEADAAAKKKADEEARLKAEQEAARKKAEEEAKERKAAKLSSDDILSVMGEGAELIDEEAPAKPATPKPAPAGGGGPAPALEPAAKAAIDDFLRAQGMEASLLLSHQGAVLESHGGKDPAALGAASFQIFTSTQKAASRMNLGGLKQIMVTGEDGRQILFVQLKACVLVAATGKSTNLGLLRVAVNDLAKKA